MTEPLSVPIARAGLHAGPLWLRTRAWAACSADPRPDVGLRPMQSGSGSRVRALWVSLRLAPVAMRIDTALALLRPFGNGRTRTVRGIGTDTVTVTPRRARCADCQVTQILLPTALTVRRADSTEAIGTALVARPRRRTPFHRRSFRAARIHRSTVVAWRPRPACAVAVPAGRGPCRRDRPGAAGSAVTLTTNARPRRPGSRHFVDQTVTLPTTPTISVFIHDDGVIGRRDDGQQSGLAALPAGRGMPAGAEVTEPEQAALFEDGADPVTGELLIRRASARFPTRAERIERRVARLSAEHPELRAHVRAGQIEKIRAGWWTGGGAVGVDQCTTGGVGPGRVPGPGDRAEPVRTTAAVHLAGCAGRGGPAVGLVPGHRRPSRGPGGGADRAGAAARAGLPVASGGSGAGGGDRHDVGPDARRAGRPGWDRGRPPRWPGSGRSGRPSTGPGSVRGLAPVGAGCAGPRR